MKHFKLMKGILTCLLSLALVVTCFTVGAKADETAEATPTKSTAVAAEYVATDDTVTAGSNAYVYVVKAASGNKIKAGTAATAQMEKGAVKISDLGIKGTKKDVYLYVCDKEIEVEETVSANLTIKGNANKVVGVIDYTQADDPGSVQALSAYYVDKSTKKQVNIDSANLYWSADQDKWYAANSNKTEGGRKDSKNQPLYDGFMGQDLAGMLEAGGTIYIKQVGTSGASGTAQFGSAVTKVKIAKQAKAPKSKIDVSKDTIALKNGFDFALAIKTKKSGEDYIVLNWYTILPVLKTATVASEGESIVGGTIGADENAKETAYKPLGKKDTNAGKVVTVEGDTTSYYSYTKVAFKTLSIDKLFEVIGDIPTQYKNGDEEASEVVDFKIAVRKSATEKKPASAYTLIDLGFQAEAPIVYTESNVDGQFLVASADEFTKKGITLGEIAAFAGYEEVDKKTLVATKGFDSTFEIKAAADSIKERDEGSTFEYAVVSTADYFATGDAAIDWTTVKWKKFNPAKLKITEKLSGKYSTVKGTKKTADLKGTASSEIKKTGEEDVTKEDAYGRTVITDEAIKDGTKSLLLIRRQGDKASGKRASEAIILYVAKENKKYNLYSTVSNGEGANKYTVVFGKYKDGDEAGFYHDESIASISGWTQKNNFGVKLDALTDAEYWTAKPVDAKPMMDIKDAAKYTPVATAVAAGEDTDAIAAGMYKLTNEWSSSAGNSQIINIAIREYANIKVKVYTKLDDAAPVAVATKDVTVTKGKIGTSDVEYYVGAECEVPVTAASAPTISDDTKEVVATDKPVTIEGAGAELSDDGKTVTVIPGSAEVVEITLTYNFKTQAKTEG